MRSRIAMGVASYIAALVAGGLPAMAQEVAGIQGAPVAHGSPSAPISIHLPAGDLIAALDALAQQTGANIAYRPEHVQGVKTKELTGSFSAIDAVSRLLAGTALAVSTDSSTGSILIAAPRGENGQSLGNDKATDSKKEAPTRSSRPNTEPKQSNRDMAQPDDQRIVGMPAVMVKGARTLNMDIERSVDDPQPYVVFDRVAIDRAGATNLNEFLRTRLPMNANIRNASGGGGTAEGVISSVDLRGLGETQTLILVDGRRLARSSGGNTSGQSDINGIPMAAIERIEVLPTTASAIYGGAATGGVINIIMRRDYVGTQVALNYDNSFDTDSAIKRIDVSSGFSMLDGKTNVLLVGSYSESNTMLVRDRNFSTRGRESIQENNPDFYYPAFVSSLGGANVVSADGSNLLFKDGTPLNSAFTWAPKEYRGISSDGGDVLLSNAGGHAPGSIDSLMSPGDELITGPRVKYFSGSVRHEFSDRVMAFVEASHSSNTSHLRVGGDGLFFEAFLPSTAPTNPFQQDVLVNTSAARMSGYVAHESKMDRFSGGLVFQLPGNWMAATDYTYSKATTGYLNASPYSSWSVLEPAYADGSIDLLGNLDSQNLDPYVQSEVSSISGPLETITKNPAIRVSGPVGTLKAGHPWLSMLIEQQDTVFGAASAYEGSRLPPHRLYPERSQKVDSAYLELKIPVFSTIHNLPWIDELEIQLAGRWDNYETVSSGFIDYLPPASPPPFAYIRKEISEFSPLAAIRFRPNESITLRASYGEGFIAPDINQLTFPQTIIGRSNTIGTVVDPRRGNTLTRAYSSEISISRGGNPDLEPEYSTTKSVGIIYTPQWLDGFRISVDYTRLSKENNIAALTPYQTLLNNEEFFPERVTRGENLPTDPDGWAGVITALDITMANVAQASLEAYDVQLDYMKYMSNWGSLELFARATVQTKYDVKLLESAPVTDSLGWVSIWGGAPLDLKGNLGVVWTMAPWTAGWTMRYSSSYYVADPSAPSSIGRLLAQGNGGRVPSQTYHDVFIKHQFTLGKRSSAVSHLIDGLELQIGVRNILNKTPPYDFSYNATYYSGIGDPRLATYYLTLRQSF